MYRSTLYRKKLLLSCILFLCLLGNICSSARGNFQGPLRVHPDNPRYFTDGSGQVIYLTGSHTWSNLVDIGPTDPPPKFDSPGTQRQTGKTSSTQPPPSPGPAQVPERPQTANRSLTSKSTIQPISTGCANGSQPPTTAGFTYP
jgi:hypothetical protein